MENCTHARVSRLRNRTSTGQYWEKQTSGSMLITTFQFAALSAPGAAVTLRAMHMIYASHKERQLLALVS